jgi:hypothetical protein
MTYTACKYIIDGSASKVLHRCSAVPLQCREKRTDQDLHLQGLPSRSLLRLLHMQVSQQQFPLKYQSIFILHY